MPAIVTDSLGKSYGGHRGPFARGERIDALGDLSIQVEEAEVFGFLGPNGAGKSTTIRLLLGYLHPTAGGARVLGHDIVRESVEIRRRTGYLPGGIAFYDGMTGSEQLSYLERLDGRPAVLRDQLVDRLQLSRRDLGRQIRDYSRGMRQKVGIIQAFQADPELAILDEPTEGLDPLMQRAFYEILAAQRDAGRTIFFSSHVLSEVERVCDRAAIVREGRLVALTDIDELRSRRRRRVEVRFTGPAPALRDVPGVSDVRQQGAVLTCQLEGDPGSLLTALGTGGVEDLLIEPARLEETFMEYYAEPGVSDVDGERP